MKSYFLGTHPNQERLERIEYSDSDWYRAYKTLEDLFDMVDQDLYNEYFGDLILKPCDYCEDGYYLTICCEDPDCEDCLGFGEYEEDCHCESGYWVDSEALFEGIEKSFLEPISLEVDISGLRRAVQQAKLPNPFFDKNLHGAMNDTLEKLLKKADKELDKR